MLFMKFVYLDMYEHLTKTVSRGQNTTHFVTKIMGCATFFENLHTGLELLVFNM
jgi:hypothetical protein